MGVISRGTTDFATVRHVYSNTSTSPYVGYENADDLPNGWMYDIKRWASPFDMELPSLPRLYCPSYQGLNTETYFTSGVGNQDIDLGIKYLDEKFFDHERYWVPIIESGWYFRFNTDFFYYSDNSRVEYIDTADNVNGRNFLRLSATPKIGKPVMAASFRRDLDTGIIYYDVRVEPVGKFTGSYSGGEELNTYQPSTNTVIWANVDTYKNEFLIDNWSNPSQVDLIFNRDYTYTVGVTPVSYEDLGTLDIIGSSDYTEQQSFYLTKFPVVPSTFELYTVDSSTQAWTLWTRVNSYQELLNAGTAGSYPSNYYYLDKDIGKVVFGTIGAGIPEDGRYICAKYDVTLRVEYEEDSTASTITAWDADVSPVTQSVNQGFVCITHRQLNPTTIVLKTDKAAVAGSDPLAYGPVYVGSDTATLRAEVYAQDGTPVPNIEVSLVLTPSTVGSIGGSSIGSSSSTTDGNGYAYSYYQPPVDAQDMGYYATSASCVQGDNLVLDDAAAGLTTDDDIYLYKVLKDDPLLGSMSLDSYLPAPPRNVTQYAVGSPNYVLAYNTWRASIIQEYGLEEWDSSIPNGRKVIVYNWDGTAINPVLGTTGAFVPTRPTSIDSTGSILTYPAGALLPSDPDNYLAYPPYYDDIGGYWVVTNRYVEAQASCYSTYYNRIIYSNTIRVKVMLPRYLLGEHVLEQTYTMPFGWKIYETSAKNHAAGLDGATFLTINPHSGPYQIIDWLVDVNNNDIPDYLEGYGTDYYTGEWADERHSAVAFKVQLTT